MDSELAIIGERLSAILEAIEKYIQGDTEERNRKRNRENIPVNVAGNIVGTIGLPETVEAKRSTDQERYHTTQQIIAVGAWGAFIGTLIYVVVAQMTLNQIKMQTAQIYHQSEVDNADASLKAAQWLKQSTLSFQQLELAERPWVEADIAINGGLTFDINGARIPLKITLRNTGHSPALSTTVSPLALIGSKSLSAINYRNQVCQDAARTAIAYPQWGVALFPNATFQRGYDVILRQKDIDSGKASKENPKANFGEVMISPAVIICVAYRPSFNNTSVYDTAYIIDLVKLHTINNAPPFVFDIGQAVEQQNLGLQFHALDGAITAH